jgi:putative ABC transport system permease protein
MDIKDRMWNLVTKKLANEASEEEEHELNKLLKQNPGIARNVNFLFEWWNGSQYQNIPYGDYLFRKILARIKNEEDSLNYTNN